MHQYVIIDNNHRSPQGLLEAKCYIAIVNAPSKPQAIELFKQSVLYSNGDYRAIVVSSSTIPRLHRKLVAEKVARL